MVRNRYLRIQRGRWLTEQGQSKNKCGVCGKLKRGHVCDVGPKLTVITASEVSPRPREEGGSFSLHTPDGAKPMAKPHPLQVSTKAEVVQQAQVLQAGPAPVRKPTSPPPLQRLGSLEVLAMAAAGVAA